MLTRGFYIALVVMLFGMTASRASPQSDFGQALREADAIRTSDSAKFSRLVLELDKEAEDATAGRAPLPSIARRLSACCSPAIPLMVFVY